MVQIFNMVKIKNDKNNRNCYCFVLFRIYKMLNGCELCIIIKAWDKLADFSAGMESYCLSWFLTKKNRRKIETLIQTYFFAYWPSTSVGVVWWVGHLILGLLSQRNLKYQEVFCSNRFLTVHISSKHFFDKLIKLLFKHVCKILRN
jgi:hypothetical protein